MKSYIEANPTSPEGEEEKTKKTALPRGRGDPDEEFEEDCFFLLKGKRKTMGEHRPRGKEN